MPGEEDQELLAANMAKAVINDVVSASSKQAQMDGGDKVQDNAAATSTDATADQKTEADDDIVDPWNVTSSAATGIDYDKLIGKCL